MIPKLYVILRTIHDYTRKGGDVHTEILLPAHAPAGFTDRAVLWNAVERIKKAKNAQLAREIELAFSASTSTGILWRLECAPTSAYMTRMAATLTPISC